MARVRLFVREEENLACSLREVVEFGAIAFGMTGALHGALLVSGRPFSLKADVAALLYASGLAGPTCAAIVVERRHGGRSGVRQLLAQGHPRTLSGRRAAGALVAQPLMMLGAARISGGSLELKRIDPGQAIGQIWVVIGEEFGWRGFVWPRLLPILGPQGATLVVAALWGLWHVPMFFVPNSLQSKDSAVQFAMAILAWSYVHSLLQLDEPSVATAMLFHAAANITNSVVGLPGSQRVLTGVYACVAIAAAGLFGLRRHSVRLSHWSVSTSHGH
jgi:membrane protease YdiL (CAAX protease family)